MDVGMNAVVYCGSMGDWPLLTTEDRQNGVKLLVDAGVKVVVGTGAQNPAQAAGHARHAQDVGAHGLMVIPRVLISWDVVGRATTPLRTNPFGCTGIARRHLQQSLLRIRNKS